MKQTLKGLLPSRTAMNLAFAVALAAVVLAPSAFAAGQFSLRKVTQTNQNPSTSNTYKYFFTTATAGVLKEIRIQSNTLATMAGTIPTGMSYSSSVLTQTGLPTTQGAWSIDTSTFAGSGYIKITNTLNTTNVTAATPITIEITNVTNSSSEGTYFSEIKSYTDTAGAALVDQGTVAFPVENATVTVDARVLETLTFSLTDNAIDLGNLSDSTVSNDTHAITLATNGEDGYQLDASGTVLTSDTDSAQTIPYPTDDTLAALTAGTANFGVKYSGTGVSSANYRNLSSSRTIATTTGPTASNAITATYSATRAANSAAGTYGASVTYNAFGKF